MSTLRSEQKTKTNVFFGPENVTFIFVSGYFAKVSDFFVVICQPLCEYITSEPE